MKLRWSLHPLLLFGVHLTTCSLYLFSTCPFFYLCTFNTWVYLFVFLKPLEKWAGFLSFRHMPNTIRPIVQQAFSETSSLPSSWFIFPTITVYLHRHSIGTLNSTCSKTDLFLCPLSPPLSHASDAVCICVSAEPGLYQAHCKYSENNQSGMRREMEKKRTEKQHEKK